MLPSSWSIEATSVSEISVNLPIYALCKDHRAESGKGKKGNAVALTDREGANGCDVEAPTFSKPSAHNGR
jgi:hypothetical protein